VEWHGRHLEGEADDPGQVARHAESIKFLARVESINWVQGEAPASASAVMGKLKLLIPVAGLIDLDAERARLDKEIKRIEVEITKSEGKLANFAGKAPPAVVEQERTRLVDWNSQLNALKEQREKI